MVYIIKQNMCHFGTKRFDKENIHIHTNSFNQNMTSSSVST